MPPTPVPGFITKKETAELFQRSHRQITRDLAEAMKVQNPRVLDHCRVHTEDGETRDGMGVTPELLDELRLAGKNPAWFLRVTWLEKTYGRRGHPQRREQFVPDTSLGGSGEGTDVTSRPDLVHVLRERIRGLEQDKQDLRDDMKIKNQQISERVEREKETNALIRNLQTLMANLQERLLPSPSPVARQIMDAHPDETRSPSGTDDILTKSKTIATAQNPMRGSRPSLSRKRTSIQSSKKAITTRVGAPKKSRQKTDAPKTPKSRTLWSRLFS